MNIRKDELIVSRRIMLGYVAFYILMVTISIVATFQRGFLPDQVGGYPILEDEIFLYLKEYIYFTMYSAVLYVIFYTSFVLKVDFKIQQNKMYVDYIIAAAVLFHLYLLFLGYGSVIRDVQLSNWIFVKLNSFLQPYFLILIYLYINVQSKKNIYRTILMLYIISAFISGFFMTLLFYIAPILIIRNYEFFSKHFKKISLIFIVTIPLYRILKYLYTVDFKFSNIENLEFKEIYIQSFVGIIDRFNFINNSSLYYKYSNYFTDLLSRSEFNPLYQSYSGNFFYKFLNSGAVQSINESATYIIYKNFESYSFFPVSTYFYFNVSLGFYLLIYLLVALLLSIILSIYLDNNRHLLLLTFIVFFIMGYAGWLWALNNFIQALIVYALITKVSNFKW